MRQKNSPSPTSEPLRIQKVLADLGIASRRVIESWIKQGTITVNGEPATLGMKISLQDKVYVNKSLVHLKTRATELPRILLYNKPEGEICTRSDPEGRPTVFSSLPKVKQGRWIMIGRLDVSTQGLLLFTTDGEVAKRMMHPSYEVEREYAVRIFGVVTDECIRKLRQGVMLEDGKAKFDSIKAAGGSGTNSWYHVVLKEGRNREVRRLWESQDLTVTRLMRVRYGKINLPRWLSRGQFSELPALKVQQLLQELKLT